MSRQRILGNIVLWPLLYLFWILIFQKRAFSFSRTMTIEFCYILFVAANYYFNIYFSIPRFLYKKKYVSFVLAMIAGIVCGALLRVPLARYLNIHYFAPGKTPPPIDELFINSFVNIFLWVTCLVAAKLIIDRIRFQKYVDNIEKEKSKTELDFLKAQFNPHFLFNSINSIYGHIDKRNPTARNMLLKFSEMLRYQLYDCNTDTISIDKEMNYVRNYVSIQRARMEESLIVLLNINENIRGFTIAPLLFIGFIENAFKYVSNHDDEENKVEIRFEKKGDTLIFSTYNTKEKNLNNSITHKGIGIANAKRRLELLYPNKHELDIRDYESAHEVILKLQLS